MSKKQKNKDLGAFASASINNLGDGDFQEGLTKREYFAAKAMQGMACGFECHSIIKEKANYALKYADALLEILEKKATKSNLLVENELGSIKSTVSVTVTDSVNVKDINNRMGEFKNSLLPFSKKYNSKLLNEFYSYWTEHGEKDKKMRFEKEKSFGLNRRLSTWFKNEKMFKEKNTPKKEKISAATLIQQKYGIS